MRGERERETDRQTDRDTDRQTDRQRQRQRDIERDSLILYLEDDVFRPWPNIPTCPR